MSDVYYYVTLWIFATSSINLLAFMSRAKDAGFLHIEESPTQQRSLSFKSILASKASLYYPIYMITSTLLSSFPQPVMVTRVCRCTEEGAPGS